MVISFVLDTNIFNMLLDGALTLDDLPEGGNLLVTHIQKDELGRTRNEARRAELLRAMEDVGTVRVPTESMVWGLSAWGEAKWGDGGFYSKVKAALDKVNNAKGNNASDALIAEVCLVNGHTLVTADKALGEVMADFGGTVRLVQWITPRLP